MRKSLLLIGFPRGFTTQTYDIVARATGLPTSGAMSGEVLNALRWEGAGLPVPAELADLGEPIFYSTRPELHDRFAAILKRYATTQAPCIIKDVVQPFHVLDYLERNPDDFQVIFLRRDLGEVVSRLRRRNWRYVHSLDALEQRMLRYPVVDARRVMYDEGYIFRRLDALGLPATPFGYLTSEFIAQRDATLDQIEAELVPRQPSRPAHFPDITPGHAYRYGTREAEPAAQAFLAEGWRPLAGRGLWTEADIAGLACRLPPLPEGGVLRLKFSAYPGIDTAVLLSLDLAGAAAPIEAAGPARPDRWLTLRLPPSPVPREAWLRIRTARSFVPARVGRYEQLAVCGVMLEALKLEVAAPDG
jgi:hypothetical protein